LAKILQVLLNKEEKVLFDFEQDT